MDADVGVWESGGWRWLLLLPSCSCRLLISFVNTSWPSINASWAALSLLNAAWISDEREAWTMLRASVVASRTRAASPASDWPASREVGVSASLWSYL